MAGRKRKYGFNRSWFEGLIKRSGRSQRYLAGRLGIDPSQLSRLLRGERAIRPGEGYILAEELGVTVDEIMVQAGYWPEAGMGTQATLPVAGWVDQHGKIHPKRPQKGPRRAPKPEGMPDDTWVIAVRAREGVLAGMDGAQLYIQPTEGVPGDCLGRLCVVRIAGEDHYLLRVPERGYSPGTYTLKANNGKVLEEDQRLDIAAPVIWAKL